MGALLRFATARPPRQEEASTTKRKRPTTGRAARLAIHKADRASQQRAAARASARVEAPPTTKQHRLVEHGKKQHIAPVRRGSGPRRAKVVGAINPFPVDRAVNHAVASRGRR